MSKPKLDGPGYLGLNHDIANRSFNRAKALEALKGLRLIAKDLGLPGSYLHDSLSRYLDNRRLYPSLESAFGLEPSRGRPQYEKNEADAGIAFEAFKQRLQGRYAKSVTVRGVSDRRVRFLFSRYLFDCIARARVERGKKGFSEEEKHRINKMLRRARGQSEPLI